MHILFVVPHGVLFNIFTIPSSIVWEINDELNNYIAQAALSWRDSAIPSWFAVSVKHK